MTSATEATTSTAAATTINTAAITIHLQPGERYAGPVLDADGNVKHHMVLLPNQPETRLNWSDAKAWATSVGGQLPDRQEQALLYANCKPHLQPKWHWSSEEDEDDASYALGCYFFYGTQYGLHKSFEGSAVAVRLVEVV